MKKSTLFILALTTILVTGWKQSAQEALYKNVVQHPFSDPHLKDIFSIKIIGNSIVGGTAVINITSHDGRTIFNEKHPANYLIGYSYTGEYDNETQKEEYIKKRVNEFFLEENFLDPAINSNWQFDEDYSNLDIWNDIKSDHSAIGFYYLIGEEAGCRIAYSKKQLKTLKYFCCC